MGIFIFINAATGTLIAAETITFRLPVTTLFTSSQRVTTSLTSSLPVTTQITFQLPR